jgi:hypothetical protein
MGVYSRYDPFCFTMLFTYCVFLVVINCGLHPLLYILEAVHSCLSFHVLTRTKTLPEDGTQVPKHVGTASVINILTKPSAQCWFSVHNPAMHGTNIKIKLIVDRCVLDATSCWGANSITHIKSSKIN